MWWGGNEHGTDGYRLKNIRISEDAFSGRAGGEQEPMAATLNEHHYRCGLFGLAVCHTVGWG